MKLREDYVSFETAKLLKDKGFPQDKETNYFFYNSDGKVHTVRFGADYDLVYARPTLYLVVKWLREEHNLYLRLVDSVTPYEYFTYCVLKKIEKDDNGKYTISTYPGRNSLTTEDTLTAGINEALELI